MIQPGLTSGYKRFPLPSPGDILLDKPMIHLFKVSTGKNLPSSNGLFSFLVWGHHMYTVGLETDTRAYFTGVTIFISLNPRYTKGYVSKKMELWFTIDGVRKEKERLTAAIIFILSIIFFFLWVYTVKNLFSGSSNLLFTIILGYRRLSVKFLYFLVSTG